MILLILLPKLLSQDNIACVIKIFAKRIKNQRETSLYICIYMRLFRDEGFSAI